MLSTDEDMDDMQYTSEYVSPLGKIMLAADKIGIVGLWFEGQKYFALRLGEHERKELPVFDEVKRWLDIYFSGREPDFTPPLHITGTEFQIAVCDIMLSISYGKTMTYGEIAAKIAEERGIAKMSAQAVGGAVGHNNISIIVPCHRVVGTGGSLTGYAGGLGRKIELLRLENAWNSSFFVTKKGTAL